MSDIQTDCINRIIETERIFAGLVFDKTGEALETCGWLAPDVIHDERIRAYWLGLKTHGDNSRAAIDAGLLLDLVSWSGRDEVWFTRPLHYARKLMDELAMYNNSLRLSDLAKAIGKADPEAMRECIQKMAGEIPAPQIRTPTALDASAEFIASLDEENATIPTYIPKIDQATAGLWRKNLIVACARPSVGKTALAWQIARNCAASGRRVLFLSLEMNKRELWARAACGQLCIPYRDVLAKRITTDQKQMLIATSQDLRDTFGARLLIDDRSNIDTAEAWRLVAQHRPGLVIVDHIRLMTDKNEKEVKRLGTITANLKVIAKEFNTAVLALAQLNRNLESREDKRPTLADLRDSGEIEENADFVLGLHRERKFLEQQMATSPAELIVLKFRNGPSDIQIMLKFDGLAQWFEG